MSVREFHNHPPLQMIYNEPAACVTYLCAILSLCVRMSFQAPRMSFQTPRILPVRMRRQRWGPVGRHTRSASHFLKHSAVDPSKNPPPNTSSTPCESNHSHPNLLSPYAPPPNNTSIVSPPHMVLDRVSSNHE